MKKVFLTGVSVAALFAAGPALASDSVVTQNGLGNDATVNQTGSTGDTDSTVTQIGYNNVAGVTQSGDNNNLTISQPPHFIPTDIRRASCRERVCHSGLISLDYS